MALLKVHTSRISWFVPSEGYYNDLGEWCEGEGTWEGNIPCDDVPSSGEMARIITEDGEERYYSHTLFIQAKYAYHDFVFGEKIRVKDDKGRVKEYSVKGYAPRQLQAKLWV